MKLIIDVKEYSIGNLGNKDLVWIQLLNILYGNIQTLATLATRTLFGFNFLMYYIVTYKCWRRWRRWRQGPCSDSTS